ncbi:MAG: hypothetical protein KatS3mg103_0645 [Phycisphaerales bacterium]|nr:MAG: hypothetical protein KatS3mg103_0645 [Phycisphaerales bacterium]
MLLSWPQGLPPAEDRLPAPWGVCVTVRVAGQRTARGVLALDRPRAGLIDAAARDAFEALGRGLDPGRSA